MIGISSLKFFHETTSSRTTSTVLAFRITFVQDFMNAHVRI